MSTAEVLARRFRFPTPPLGTPDPLNGHIVVSMQPVTDEDLLVDVFAAGLEGITHDDVVTALAAQLQLPLVPSLADQVTGWADDLTLDTEGGVDLLIRLGAWSLGMERVVERLSGLIPALLELHRVAAGRRVHTIRHGQTLVQVDSYLRSASLEGHTFVLRLPPGLFFTGPTGDPMASVQARVAEVLGSDLQVTAQFELLLTGDREITLVRTPAAGPLTADERAEAVRRVLEALRTKMVVHDSSHPHPVFFYAGPAAA